MGLGGRGNPPPVPEAAVVTSGPRGGHAFSPRAPGRRGGHGGHRSWGSRRAHDLTLEPLMAPLPLSPRWPLAPMPWDQVVRLPCPSGLVRPSRPKCQLLWESSPLSCMGAKGALAEGLLCSVPQCLPTNLQRQRHWAVGCPGSAPQSLLKASLVPGRWWEWAAPSPTTAGAWRGPAGLGSPASALVAAHVGAALVVLQEPARTGSGCSFRWPGHAGVCAPALRVGRGQLVSPGPSPLTCCRPRRPPLGRGSAPHSPGGHALPPCLDKGPRCPGRNRQCPTHPPAAQHRCPSQRAAHPPLPDLNL